MRGSAAFRVAVAPGGALAGPWVQNSLWTAAHAVPSLDLRFADNKSLVDATTGASLVTFTRASTGTFVDSDGVLRTATTNEARFDHNPTTGESLGLLVEEARTNLLLRSEEFESASWINLNTTESSNVAVAPNGTLTADKLIENSGAGFKSIDQVLAISALTYTFSIYAKAVERSIVQLLWSGGASTNFANFNLATGTVTAGTYTSATITPAGSGWFRLSITSALAAGTYSGIVSLQTNASATRAASYTGDGTSGFFIWGAQMEAGAFPTSYIPTTTATATRAADVASITGTAFSSWYRQDEGTVFAEWVKNGSSNFQTMAAFSDGTSNNLIALTHGSGAPTNNARFDVNTGGVSQVTLVLVTGSVVGTSYKNTGTYKVNDFAAASNGGSPLTDTSGSIPTTSQLTIGANSGAGFLNGTIKRLAFWPVRLANNTLQAISQP